MRHTIPVHSTSELGKIYDLVISTEIKQVYCPCKGFQVHKRCKHVRFYKVLIKALMRETPGVKSEKGGN